MFTGERCAPSRQRGVVAVLTLVLLFVMVGFAALTIDVGAMYNTRGDLQDAADSAALAAAAALTTDEMMAVRMDNGSIDSVEADGHFSAHTYSQSNPSFGRTATYLQTSDINFGWLDLLSSNSPVIVGVAGEDVNAVTVTARRTSESSNGPLDAMFSRIFGTNSLEVTATATASFDDRISGFDTNLEPGMLPFTIHENLYNQYLSSGDDDYSYDGDDSTISSGSDGVREVNLFPHGTAPGNFGILNIGTPNQGTPALRNDIENGVDPEDFEAETGSAILTFWENGSPTTYQITGNPGMHASLESSIMQRQGEVVGYFLHNNYVEQGANATYTITRVVFARVMDVQLNGPPSQRGIFLQPTSQVGGGVHISVDAPSSNGEAGRLVISR